MVTCARVGLIYTSADSGAHWTACASVQNWQRVCSSADGMLLVATATNGHIYTSDDAGEHWVPRATNQNWMRVASSADGTKLLACAKDGLLYTSIDSGVTWTPRATTQSWYGASMSSDGTRLFATTNGGQLYTLSTGGATVSQTAVGVGEGIAGPRGTAVRLQYAGNDVFRVVNYTRAGQCGAAPESETAPPSTAAGEASGAFPWQTVTSPTQMAGNTGYIADAEKTVTLTLPPSSSLAIGDTVCVKGRGLGGWKIAQGASQSILTGLLGTRDFSAAWRETESVREWTCIACSPDGGKLVAGVLGKDGGQLLTSSDCGVTWTQRREGEWWYGVASSADGVRMVAVAGGSYIYISKDSGATWTAHLTDKRRDWAGVASSADGMKLVAGANVGHAFTSSDGGETWTEQPASCETNWCCIASSADGNTLATCGPGGRIWISKDAGVQWATRDWPRRCRGVAMSADGRKLVACASLGRIWVSEDSGETWFERESKRNWRAIASSADGVVLAAHDEKGCFYVSTDSGVTWQPRGAKAKMMQIAVSADGERIALCCRGGRIGIVETHGAIVKQTPVGKEGYIAGPADSSVELCYDGNDTFSVRRCEGRQEARGLSGERHPNGAYLLDWLVAGPLNAGARGESVTSLFGGAEAAYREGDSAPGCEHPWTRYRGGSNVINLREIVGCAQPTTAVAFCEFESDTDQVGRVYCATQNTLQLCLNGELVLAKAENSEPLIPEVRDLELRRGTNSFLVLCSVTSAPLLGFTLRVDGAEATANQPLIWDPLVPGLPFEWDGRYALLSPDWKWRAGDESAWAAPNFDDSAWERAPASLQSNLMRGAPYWMRIRAHFAPDSTLVPYSFEPLNAQDMRVYMDGVPVLGTESKWTLTDPFAYPGHTFLLPRECTLAVRVISDGHADSGAYPAVRRADKGMSEELRDLQPRKFHRLFLAFCLLLVFVYHAVILHKHPLRREGGACGIVAALALLSMMLSIPDSWTFRHALPALAWMSPVLAGVAYAAGIVMMHVMADGAVNWRFVLGYAVAGTALFLGGWGADMRWLAFAFFPLVTIEYLRVWIAREVIPRRANWVFVGIGLLLLVAGQIATACFALSNDAYFHDFGAHAHLYGLVALATCLVAYLSRQFAGGMRDSAELEERIDERTRQVKLLTLQVIAAEEAERERLSRELHDGIAQTLCFAKMAAEGQTAGVASGTGRDDVVNLLEKAIQEVRAMAYGLRPPELDKLGFVQAISHCCRDFSDNTGISLDYEAHGVDNVVLDPVVEVNLYRVLQEALSNVQQHAQSSNVRVRLVGASPSVILRVEDNGCGFDVAAQRAKGSGMGLHNMEERTRLVEGTMRIRTAPGEGTRIIFEVPQQEREA